MKSPDIAQNPNGLMAFNLQIGTVTIAMDTDKEGQISLFGVLWRSVSDFPICCGEKVQVLNRQGLTLKVEPLQKKASVASLAYF